MKFSAKKGVTLIELVTVMAIISIGTAIVLVSLSGSRAEKELEAEARKVAAIIKEAQNYSLTGKNTASCVPIAPSTTKSNRLTVTPNGNSYALSGCNSAAYTLGYDIIFSGGTVNYVDFSVPHGAVTFDVATATGRITLSKSGRTYSICIGTGGLVEEKSGSSC